ncbi:MAG TPA: DUF779 domain-containing protein [Actinospica sp.]|nr:DUF779 domain-containing protein [Actinospica sp.]
MPDPQKTVDRVTATPAARAAIAAVRAEEGPLMFVLSHGCCDGTAPLCFKLGDFLTGPRDLLIGTVEGCPFYLEGRRHPEIWERYAFILDVEPGHADGFSLPAGDDEHFVVRSRFCA